ncbi:hypothetical protein [Streptomyces sp. MA15]|uniref:hypothetical protein n=1 Tax=Streptomyces sp. MA15 TaxID=3055061 RepID=UPI0025B23058|nr:hypothetical protein [Streptomyces sp. MA15]MDN3271742.1 hypothetical protein [Streptomyces sp. MA15]
MTASTPPPPPPSTPPAPPATRRPPSRWVAPVVAAVVAAGAGLGIGWLLWSGPDSAASGTGVDDAAADAAGACQAWQRVPAFSTLASGDKDAAHHFNRAISAAYLAQTAAELDDRYKALNEAFQDVHGHLRTFKVEGAEAEAAHEKVTTLCADLDG